MNSSEDFRYLFILAERLKMTVGELQMRMTSDEFSGWLAHDRSHATEGWLQSAQVAHTVACCFADKPPPFDSFLPQRIRPAAEPMSEAQIRANLATYR